MSFAYGGRVDHQMLDSVSRDLRPKLPLDKPWLALPLPVAAQASQRRRVVAQQQASFQHELFPEQ